MLFSVGSRLFLHLQRQQQTADVSAEKQFEKSNILFGTMLENHSDWTGYSDSEENGIGVSFKCFFQAIVYTVYSKLKI